jgi:hypothetical protein
MADCYPATIKIGGEISRPVAEELVEQINNDNLSDDYNSRILHKYTVETLIENANEHGGVVYLEDHMACWGQFDIEIFLKKNNIPFNRHSSQYWDCSAVTTYFRAGVETDIPEMDDGTEIVDGNDVRKLLESYQSNDLSVERFIMEIKMLLTPTPGPLPKLRIVE